MKKLMFIILWMIIGACVGFAMWSIFLLVMIHITPNATSASAWTGHRLAVVCSVDVVCCATPIVALLLGIFGKLPGTRSKKQSVQT